MRISVQHKNLQETGERNWSADLMRVNLNYCMHNQTGPFYPDRPDQINSLGYLGGLRAAGRGRIHTERPRPLLCPEGPTSKHGTSAHLRVPRKPESQSRTRHVTGTGRCVYCASCVCGPRSGQFHCAGPFCTPGRCAAWGWDAPPTGYRYPTEAPPIPHRGQTPVLRHMHCTGTPHHRGPAGAPMRLADPEHTPPAAHCALLIWTAANGEFLYAYS